MSFAARLLALQQEALAASAEESQAATFFERARWPDGPRCVDAACGSDDIHRVGVGGKTEARRVYRCRRCRRQFTWRKGTSFEGDLAPARALAYAVGRAGAVEPDELGAELEDLGGLSALVARRVALAVTSELARGVSAVESRGEAPLAAVEEPPSRPTVVEPTEPATKDVEPDPVDAGEPRVRNVEKAPRSGRRGRSWVAVSLLAAVLLAVGIARFFAGGETLRRTWFSNGERVRISTVRNAGEGPLDWYRRHVDIVRAMKAAYPPVANEGIK